MNDQIQSLPNIAIKRALISVSDKTGIVELTKKLHERHIEIISTGGTAKTLQNAGIPVTGVSEITQFPECLDGRVKTLHPLIHGALLARPSLEDHAKAVAALGIRPIQLVVVNLYPFQDAITSKPDDLENAVENIDIGGPAMIRAAAKNFENVCVLTRPEQYRSFLSELDRSDNCISAQTRAGLAQQAFGLTATYDEKIAKFLLTASARPSPSVSESTKSNTSDTNASPAPDCVASDSVAPHPVASATESNIPEILTLQAPLFQSLRYGENPHQSAAVFGDPSHFIECFHGKELSYNNYMDIDAALQLGADFLDSNETLCAIFKHCLPCGVALSDTTLTAWENAFATDTTSPFGGIVLFNRIVDMQTAQAVDRIFTEIILAPDFENDALALLEQKSNRRLIRIRKWPDGSGPNIRTVTGGYLRQQSDFGFETENRNVVTRIQPDNEQNKSLEFAWKVVKHVKSNAIVYANHCQTLGIGTGQPNRVDSSRFAVQKALNFGHSLHGSVMASDAFFPFADSVEEAARAGVGAIIQPGGSIRDEEVIQAADRFDITMVFTGNRHFRH